MTVHPALFLFMGVALLPFVSTKKCSVISLVAPALAFFSLLLTPLSKFGISSFLGQPLLIMRVDRLSLLFGYVFALSGFIGMLYSFHIKSRMEQAAALLYIGSALGVVFAGDLITLFVFWEGMALSSVFLVWGGGNGPAGMRYLMVHLFGGTCLLLGIILHLGGGGSTLFGSLVGMGPGSMLILLGFMLNAAVPPLHAWLTDAYPEASVTGAVFMSVFTTKTAVYTLMRGFPGTEMLVYFGVFMALYGVVYAVLENDMRRLLAYHIISQVGYMVAAIGIGTEMAINGAAAHAFSHILYKGLLFMGTGAVLHETGRRKLTDLGGIYRSMPITFWLYMVGGFSISAFPLFSGFVSKSMVVSAAMEDHRPIVFLLLTFASAGTFLHTGLKLPYFIFWGRDAGIVSHEPPINMRIGMGVAAFLCILIGVQPTLLYNILPYPVSYHPYTAQHIVSTLQLLLFTALAFFLLLKQLSPEAKISVDFDLFYRKGVEYFLWMTRHPVVRFEERITGWHQAIIGSTLRRVAACRAFDANRIDGLVNAIGRGVFSGGKMATWIEKYLIYGLVNWIGYGNHVAARLFKRLQTGRVNHYAMILIVGVFVLVNLYLLLFVRR